MRKLQVHSLPLKDVIHDLAHAMDVKVQRDCGEYSIVLPKSWGEGRIRGINYEGGIGLLIYECTFNSDVEISFTVNEIHPLKFLYCLLGQLVHRFEKVNTHHELLQFQNIIVASKGHDGHILQFSEGESTEIYSLEIDRKAFKSKMSCELGKAEPQLQHIFNDSTADESFYYNGHYSLMLSEIFDELKTHHYSHFIGKIFSESQSYRLLTHQLIQFDDDSKVEGNKVIMRKMDVEAILEAVDIIKSELDDLGSIASIAQRVGLSGNKFQNGFKSLYGKTANEYIQYVKLTLAAELLMNTDDTVQQIKYKIGFNSHSYFSHLFKKVYNVTPSTYRQNYLVKEKANIKN
ncbi:MAG: helix-turn-helix transcriptional regulator [Aquaticitalea sp.]